MQSFLIINNWDNKKIALYPHESGNTMLFPLLVLILFTLFIGFLGIPFNQEGIDLDIVSKWLTPPVNLLQQKFNNKKKIDWSEFVINATLSVSIAYSGIVIASFLYKPIYSSLQKNFVINFFPKRHPNGFFFDKIQNVIYDWAHHRGYIDAFYTVYIIRSVRGLSELVEATAASGRGKRGETDPVVPPHLRWMWRTAATRALKTFSGFIPGFLISAFILFPKLSPQFCYFLFLISLLFALVS